MIRSADIGEQLCSTGLLIGLLTPGSTPDTVEINTAWFSDPITQIEQCGDRIQDLVRLLDAVLGPAISGGPAVFADAQWYTIPNPLSGTPTSFKIVASAKSEASGQIGLGALDPISLGAISGFGYAYIPLFSYSPTGGVEPLVASQTNPCLVGCTLTGTVPFTVQSAAGNVSFTGVDLVGSVYLNLQAYEAATPPNFVKLVFDGLSGSTKPNTYTSLTALLDPDVEAWLLQVVIQSGTWLNTYLGNSTFTLGDLLEGAGILGRSYTFVAGNFTDPGQLASVLAAKAPDAVSAWIWTQLPATVTAVLSNTASTPTANAAALVDGFNGLIAAKTTLYEETRFDAVALTPQTTTWMAQNPQGAALLRLNRMLLDDAYRGLIIKNPYMLELDSIKGSASDIALRMVFNILNMLSLIDFPLISLPGGGIYVAARTNADSSQDYGLRVVLDLPLTGGGQNTSPAIHLCVGTWLSGETTRNWMEYAGDTTAENPGITAYLLHHDTAAGTYSFAPELRFVSLGLNIQGGGDTSLVSLDGYTLKGVEFRSYFVPPMGTQTAYNYGFAVRLDEVGFPAAGSLDAAKGAGNPVATSMMSGGGDSGTSDTVNPAFSAKAGYMKGNTPFFQAIDNKGADTDVIWFPVQKQFGPLDCSKVGIKMDKQTVASVNEYDLGILFDGGVKLGGLDIDLTELSVTVNLAKAADMSSYTLGLEGMDVTFNASSVAVSAGLVKTIDSDGTVSYDGEALLKFKDYTITALGAYSSLSGGGTSMFIFAVMDKALGGPACFYVTGVAAGFGYNRSLKIPSQDDVQSFPLLAGLSDPSAMGGSNPDPATALAKLEDWVPPMRGEYWLAVGVQFTTFKVINTNALLMVEFGNDLLIAVLGISILQQPAQGETYVYAELDIEILIEPDAGEVVASAMLASSSYVLTQDAHLTGGFAFSSWFGSNAHAGDFVFTVGGYHPAFVVPSHYPTEPRLGINWQITDDLTLTGGAYFAITPSAMMAGCSISVVYDAGDLKAWLAVALDVLLYYSPFYLIADGSISVGVSYRLNLLFCHVTLSVEIGADFHLWGPAIGGSVHIDWYIISFTIGFGADQVVNDSLTWEQFKGMLPTKATPSAVAASQSKLAVASQHPVMTAAVGGLATTVEAPAYLHIYINDGLKSTYKEDDGKGDVFMLWLVRPGRFQFTVGSAIPCNAFVVDRSKSDPGTGYTLPTVLTQVGMRRLNGGVDPVNFASTQHIAILKLANTSVADIQNNAPTAASTNPLGADYAALDGWTLKANNKNLPQALWGSATNTVVSPDTQVVPGTVGVIVTPTDPAFNNATPVIVIEDIFADMVINKTHEASLPLLQNAAAVGKPPQVAGSFIDIADATGGVMSSAVTVKRAAVCAALLEFGISGWTNGDLTRMAQTPGKDFADEPMEGSTVAA